MGKNNEKKHKLNRVKEAMAANTDYGKHLAIIVLMYITYTSVECLSYFYILSWLLNYNGRKSAE